MDISLEAAIAILALLTALPSSILIVWNCIQNRRKDRRRQGTYLHYRPLSVLQDSPVYDIRLHNFRQLASRQLLSASIEIVVDDGAYVRAPRWLDDNSTGLGHGYDLELGPRALHRVGQLEL
ncbi:hypothetical protein B0T14DRAFT_522083 [Immersiella caudata]|uniref:Uncharacterized protein n=1 Tax=Immersiella caudata TaxID=314043 RepID=A0AA39WSG1_9PEZI|nr:hypothetical protein B0T14DRAFT_522083 [Immersiella caudata]